MLQHGFHLFGDVKTTPDLNLRQKTGGFVQMKTKTGLKTAKSGTLEARLTTNPLIGAHICYGDLFCS